jgi:RNA polymerase sigma-70 factor (sigma-E family)
MFVTANAHGLLRAAYLLTWDEQEASDLVQECFSKVVDRWPRISRMEHPLAYVRRVLVNLALDNARRHSRRRAELVGTHPDDGGDAGSTDAGQDLSDIVAERDELIGALGELAPRQRAVLVMRYFLDLSEADTARTLGCTTGTVKSTTAKALARLRGELESTRSIPEV